MRAGCVPRTGIVVRSKDSTRAQSCLSTHSTRLVSRSSDSQVYLRLRRIRRFIRTCACLRRNSRQTGRGFVSCEVNGKPCRFVCLRALVELVHLPLHSFCVPIATEWARQSQPPERRASLIVSNLFNGTKPKPFSLLWRHSFARSCGHIAKGLGTHFVVSTAVVDVFFKHLEKKGYKFPSPVQCLRLQINTRK